MPAADVTGLDLRDLHDIATGAATVTPDGQIVATGDPAAPAPTGQAAGNTLPQDSPQLPLPPQYQTPDPYAAAPPQYQPDPTPAAAAARSIMGHRDGYTPDYQALLRSDPLLLQQQADSAAQDASDVSGRKAATARLLAMFGFVPDFQNAANGVGLDNNYLSADVTPDVTALANQTTGEGLSTVSQLNRRHDSSVMSLQQQLAASGLLQSGALGVGLGQEGDRAKQERFQAESQLLDNLLGVQRGYAQAAQGRAGQLGQAAQDAAARQVQLHPAVAGTDVQATLDAASGLYKDQFGNSYNQDGSVSQLAAPSANVPSAAPASSAAAPVAAVYSPPPVGSISAQPRETPFPAQPAVGTPDYEALNRARVGLNATLGSPAPAAAAPVAAVAAPTFDTPPQARTVANSLLKRLNLPGQ